MVLSLMKLYLPLLALLLAAGLPADSRAQGPRTPVAIPEHFPRFIVPGHEKEMTLLRELFWHHYQPAGPLIPLWDAWMPMSTLWPAQEKARNSTRCAGRWAGALAARPMAADGYVSSQQHDGPAHAEGWPFPLWTRPEASAGTLCPSAFPVTRPRWQERTAGSSRRPAADRSSPRGWLIELTAPGATAQCPPFAVEARVAPWLRLNWRAEGLDGADCYVEWTTREQPEFAPERRVYFSPAGGGLARASLPMGGNDGKLEIAQSETRTMLPVYRLPGWKGTITGLRIGFDNKGQARVIIKSFHTACDTRHNINNPNFIRGCHDYFLWSRDLAFLRGQMGRIRTVMRFTMREFDTCRRKCVYTTWPGHEGRSGVRLVDGKKTVLPGEGIGSNYWDILPFGGEDALATIYYYDAVLDLAELEEQVAAHPQWNMAAGADAFDPADLRRHAAEVKDYGTKRFWNAATGRFGTVNLDGALHDYGFTFLNNEAVYCRFATPEQARSIHAWLSGQRTVPGDTSTGKDIYRWRFGPRSTTRRNLDYYFWGWSSPESIPFGNQVQDGGALLGFSYHDLMARLATAGPDDAWQRLQEVLAWYDEVQAAGGYREYYKDPARGTMQGGNIAGGLGLDKEFFELILVPQVVLYGFLGFQPTADGFAIDPRLPSTWKELTVTRIHLHEHVIDVRVAGDVIEVRDYGGNRTPLTIIAPPQRKVKVVSH